MIRPFLPTECKALVFCYKNEWISTFFDYEGFSFGKQEQKRGGNCSQHSKFPIDNFS